MKEKEKKQPSRRDFLKLLGFSTALAACSRMPVEKAIPYLVKPEEVVPGVANWYATACAGCSASCGLLVKSRDGRPIKIEGNPESPMNRGGVCAVGQATVLSLYDDARLKGPRWEGQERSWEEVDKKIIEKLAQIASSGQKVVVLSGTITSPTTRDLIGKFLGKFGNSAHVVYDPISIAAIPESCERNFGLKIFPHYRLERAKMIVGLNCDFLGTWISPVEFMRDYSSRRKPEGEWMSRHIQFESRMSLTGSNADLRIPIDPSEELPIVSALFKELVDHAGTAPDRILKVADELRGHRGESLVVSGTNDPAIQSVVNAINSLLGNIGKTVDLDNPSYQKQGNDQALVRLLDEMDRGEIAALILYGVNPVYDLGKSFAENLKKIPLTISFADRLDETSEWVRAVCPDHHFLESWNDAQPNSFTWHLTQPVIRPLFDTRAAQEGLLRWMGGGDSYYDTLRSWWKERLFPGQSEFLSFDAFWDRAVHDGVFKISLRKSYARSFRGDFPKGEASPAPQEGEFDLDLYEPVAMRDGRHANNPWLQELPDPVTKVTWDNYASLAPKTAESLSVKEGDVVRIRTEKGEIELPVQIQPGQAARSVAVALGYGRARCGKAGEGVGINAYPLTDLKNGFRFYTTTASLEKTGRTIELAVTQTHHSMEGRPIIRETILSKYRNNRSSGNEGRPHLATLWAEKPEGEATWGMVIDLNACTGCSACVIGCQAENNVPVVGRDEVRRRREMHWIRIDRYYNGDEENPETVHQPVMCQHCGHAPCETVCPVLATVHSSDGLNQQIYNRCVGTRYCNNNCPYKVRRFNWFQYAQNDKFDFHFNSPLGTMVLNPDVVVRSRGVMEKCSMCVQRIQEGKLEAKKEGWPVRDGEIKTACQQSCPTEAIRFGNLQDLEGRAAKQNKDERFYHLLEELNVQPTVGYLTKVRNKDEG